MNWSVLNGKLDNASSKPAPIVIWSSRKFAIKSSATGKINRMVAVNHTVFSNIQSVKALTTTISSQRPPPRIRVMWIWWLLPWHQPQTPHWQQVNCIFFLKLFAFLTVNQGHIFSHRVSSMKWSTRPEFWPLSSTFCFQVIDLPWVEWDQLRFFFHWTGLAVILDSLA